MTKKTAVHIARLEHGTVAPRKVGEAAEDAEPGQVRTLVVDGFVRGDVGSYIFSDINWCILGYSQTGYNFWAFSDIKLFGI